MHTEDNLLPLSALQHLIFCERQCALIHVETLWADNRLTVEGRGLHKRVHEADDETRGDVHIVRGLRLRSLRLGLTGQADVVEFHRHADGSDCPFPVEFKRGRPKPDTCDEVQLCAQALCLEEMLSVDIPEGAIFYGQPRRRHAVELSPALRDQTEQAAERLHRLIASGLTPPAVYEKKCDNCSLVSLCLPRIADRKKSALRYLNEVFPQ